MSALLIIYRVYIYVVKNSNIFIINFGLGLEVIQGEPHHITLQIDLLKHFEVSAFEILKKKV